MTPGARAAAAITVLDRVLAGTPAEQALTTWARGNRYAGSKDRAAIRDLVFDALRRRRSFAVLGGAETGRGLVLGAARAEGRDPAEWFSGEGYAPQPLTDAEQNQPPVLEALSDPVRFDYPDWLHDHLADSLGAERGPVMAALQCRAPVFLRVNRLKSDHEAADRALREEGITSHPHPLATTAREVTANARRLRQSRAYREGLVELQDAASQAVVETLAARVPGARVLDYCAGGGGKALALAALGPADLVAHDANPRRMADLPDRATRAGARVRILAPGEAAAAGPWDVVLADVPCSGSGAWRRQAEAKWRLDANDLDDLVGVQADILDRASTLLTPDGVLAYATCSILAMENAGQVSAFLERNLGWSQSYSRQFLPSDGGDGFFVAHLRKVP